MPQYIVSGIVTFNATWCVEADDAAAARDYIESNGPPSDTEWLPEMTDWRTTGVKEDIDGAS